MKEKQSTKEVFIRAYKEKKKVFLTYYSGEFRLVVTKLCVPIQYINSVSKLECDCYYFFWDEKAEVGDRLFGLSPEDIVLLELSDDNYDPNDYIVPNMSEA